jgi:Asp-tRNA(Asn)/Glu-tRNA(Gln) amidotransferase A subunit family amidase
MLHTYTLAALRDGLARGDFSSRELTQHFLTRIKQYDAQLIALLPSVNSKHYNKPMLPMLHAPTGRLMP